MHGDTHAGNVLHDGNKLRLIDYAEARFNGVTARRPKTSDQRRVYVERLADYADQFTKNQLINIFRIYWNSAGCSHDTIDDLMMEYDSSFVEEQAPDPVTVDGFYDRLSGALIALSPDTLIENPSILADEGSNVVSVSAGPVEVQRKKMEEMSL